MAYTISDSTKTPFMVNSILALMISCNTLFPDEYDSLRRTFRDAGTGHQHLPHIGAISCSSGARVCNDHHHFIPAHRN